MIAGEAVTSWEKEAEKREKRKKMIGWRRFIVGDLI